MNMSNVYNMLLSQVSIPETFHHRVMLRFINDNKEGRSFFEIIIIIKDPPQIFDRLLNTPFLRKIRE